MKEELLKIREQIDSVDDNLMELLRKRATLAKQAGDIKQQSGDAKDQNGDTKFVRLDRQAAILQRLAPKGELLSEESVQAIYREIISGCLAVEKPPIVAYLGPEYTFTHEAARKFFGESAEYRPTASIREAKVLAEKSVCDFAVLPFENSSDGTVGEAFDALLNTSLSIESEIMLSIHHNLLARPKLPLLEIDTVMAHPQALAQCRSWLQENIPQAKIMSVNSNAFAAKHAATCDENFAAIASLSAGKHYGLETLADNIADSAFNTTRFLILGNSSPEPTESDKTSFVMTTHSEAGALYHLLEPLRIHGINMTKFESRTVHGSLWEYIFFVEIDGHQKTPVVEQALDKMRERTGFLKILGSYPKAVK